MLVVIGFFSLIFFLIAEMGLFEKKRAHMTASSYQSSLAAESGLSAAMAQLSLATRNQPTFLVGTTNAPGSLARIFHTDCNEEDAKADGVRRVMKSDDGCVSTYCPRKTSISTQHPSAFPVSAVDQYEISGLAPVLMIGATHLTNKEQLMPLISGDLGTLSRYPKLDEGAFDTYLEACQSKDPNKSVDINRTPHPIAPSGSYRAPWVILKNQEGHPTARYAYVILDEQARLNPILHQGKPRNNPTNWDEGASAISCSLLLGEDEEKKAHTLSPLFFPLEGWKAIFENPLAYDQKKEFLSSTSITIPPLIPAGLPEEGRTKYDLNDLATNPIYGATPCERALYIASIIDHNLPHFKERDPSLKNLSLTEQRRYLNRLAACIVNYIGEEEEPIIINQGEPAGAALTPLATQIAERCRLLDRSSNSVTIESQYFLQLWNPYTTSIRAGGRAALEVKNRQRLHCGTASLQAFDDYVQTRDAVSSLRPNESIVVPFPSVIQRWHSETALPSHQYPYWLKGPEGNRDKGHHQAFSFSWNGHLVMMSRRSPIGPGLAEGGLEHDAQSLTDMLDFWQCNFIPTEVDQSGHFRFVGDPRENYLSNYLWKSYSSDNSYLRETRWKGVMSDASPERLFDPVTSWNNRDYIPLNPVPGNHPTSRSMPPDQVSSLYQESRDAIMAPLVMRHGPMHSIVELGHINDPAQADDLGHAPMAGSMDHKSSIYASGGGRTLRVGQPEFSYWDVPGMRAIELLDLFTVATQDETGPQGENKSLHQTIQANTTLSHQAQIFHTHRDEETAKADGVPPAAQETAGETARGRLPLGSHESARRASPTESTQTSILPPGCMSTYCLRKASNSTQDPSGFPVSAVDRCEISRLGLININTAPDQVLSALFYGITPTADQRFTNSMISAKSSTELARLLKEHRPYEKLSDLRIITSLLANATTYTPSLSTNILSDGKSVAAVFDRAREEGFGKMISLCTMQSRAFRVYVIGESLNTKGTQEHNSLLEASILLLPKDKKDDENHVTLIPVIERKEWLSNPNISY